MKLIFSEISTLGHIITALYYDMLGWYYDVLVAGAYYPENEEEAELLRNELKTMELAITEMEQSSDPRSTAYLTKYYISHASILIRSYPTITMKPLNCSTRCTI